MCRIGGLETKSHDGGGKPPFPLVATLTADQMEYANQCLDYMLLGGRPKAQDNAAPGVAQPFGEIVGFLKEFKEQQQKPPEEAFHLAA